MKGLVMIPCCNRPGWLRVCLEHISRANGFLDYAYFFSIDRGKTVNDDVIEWFRTNFPVEVRVARRPSHQFRGNVFNFMNAFREAYDFTVDGHYIHVIEDDIFIAPDYFDFHEKAWRVGPKAFFVSACRNQNFQNQLPAGDERHVYFHKSYQSLGVSFPRKSLSWIIPHCTPDYWKYPESLFEYLNAQFPGSPIPAIHAEQAGLIHRIILAHNFSGIYPIVPRAYHAGFVGSNRGGAKHPSEYSAREIREMDGDRMNREAGRRKDITPCEMVFRQVDELELI